MDFEMNREMQKEKKVKQLWQTLFCLLVTASSAAVHCSFLCLSYAVAAAA